MRSSIWACFRIKYMIELILSNQLLAAGVKDSFRKINLPVQNIIFELMICPTHLDRVSTCVCHDLIFIIFLCFKN